LYTTSSKHYSEGYEILRSFHPIIQFVNQRDCTASFKELTIQGIDLNKELTSFLVDDDVFITSLSESLAVLGSVMLNEPRLTAISLRMGPNICECYTNGGNPSPPPASFCNSTWEWPGAPGDWGYPASLDGNIFRTMDILPLLRELSYTTPNALEGILANSRRLPGNLMCCLDKSILVNIPANLVQEGFNRNEGGSALALNEGYLSGLRISLDSLRGLIPRAPHMPLIYLFEKYDTDKRSYYG
jgi:hypothetical protein